MTVPGQLVAVHCAMSSHDSVPTAVKLHALAGAGTGEAAKQSVSDIDLAAASPNTTGLAESQLAFVFSANSAPDYDAKCRLLWMLSGQDICNFSRICKVIFYQSFAPAGRRPFACARG